MKKIIKKILKQAFNFLGYQVHRKIPGRHSLADALEYISKQGFLPATVIDAGVANGTFELYETFPHAKFLLIEPIKEFEEAIKLISKRYSVEVVIAAAADKPGSRIINVHRFIQSSSLFRETEGKHVDGVPREVPVVTIDELCSQRHLKAPYLIKMDIHGAELIALEGARNVLGDTEVVILESHFFQFFINGPQFYDVVHYMKERGFCVYDICGLHYRPLDEALGAADIVFVKENGLFRKTHSYSTYEQRQKSG